MSEAAAPSARTLNGIFPGSWIDADFFIWIGHSDDLRAWRQLREARQIFDRAAPTVSAASRERACQLLLIAEGSDWFWWYGDDHSSEHDLVFDDLFRRHLRNVYQILGQPIPEELFVTNISTAHVPLSGVTPVGLLHPVLDGKPTSYFEWLAAGSVETDVPSGTMTGSERQEHLLQQLLFGFDLEHLYLRLDLGDSARRKLEAGLRCNVNFTTPADRRLVLLAAGRESSAVLYQRASSGAWLAMNTASPRMAAADILEAAVSFTDLGLRPGSAFAFFVSLQNGAVELERHPAHRPVESFVPEPAFEKLNWKA